MRVQVSRRANWIGVLAIHNKNFDDLLNFVTRYWSILKGRKKQFDKAPSKDGFLKVYSSFDEIYQTVFERDIDNLTEDDRQVVELLELAGVNDKDLAEVL